MTNFVEEFALADDRAEPLKSLIPGSEEYYYYHCLYHEQRGAAALWRRHARPNETTLS